MQAYYLTNREDPLLREYYRHLADLNMIFWIFHRMRIHEGSMPIAWGKFGIFDPDEAFGSRKERNLQLPASILQGYTNGVVKSFGADWDAFAKAIGVEEAESQLLSDPSKEYIAAIAPVARDLYQAATKVALQMEGAHNYEQTAKRRDVGRRLLMGSRTGAEVTTHMLAIFQEKLMPTALLMLSKVSLGSLTDVQEQIGMMGIHDLRLLHSEQQVDKEKLKQHEYGKVLGCIASIPPSRSVVDQLTDIGKRLGFSVPSTMLSDYIAEVKTDFEKRILPWYRELSPEGRMLVYPGDRQLLDGEPIQILQQFERWRQK